MNLTRHPLAFDTTSDRFDYLVAIDGPTAAPHDNVIDRFMTGTVDEALNAVLGEDIDGEAMLEDWHSDGIEVSFWIEAEDEPTADRLARRIARLVKATRLYTSHEDELVELGIRAGSY